MSWEAVGALGEWAGALTVVATLVYLAIQIRQNSESMRSTTELEASRQLAQVVSRISADSNLKRIWDEVSNGNQLAADDERDYAWVLAEFFHTAEGIYIQHVKGLLSEEIWGEYERMMVGYLQSDVGRRWWYEVRAPFSAPFRDHVNALLSQSSGWKIASITQTKQV